jgi:hypothetical protein
MVSHLGSHSGHETPGAFGVMFGQIDLYKANHTVATRLLHMAFWLRKMKRLKQGEKGLEKSCNTS